MSQMAYSPFQGYNNAQNVVPLPQAAQPISTPGTTASGDLPSILNPQNPMFWFGALAAVSLGLIGFGANVRIAKAKVSANVGEA